MRDGSWESQSSPSASATKQQPQVEDPPEHVTQSEHEDSEHEDSESEDVAIVRHRRRKKGTDSQTKQCERLKMQLSSLKSRHKVQLGNLRAEVSNAKAQAKDMKIERDRLKKQVASLTAKTASLASRLASKDEAYTRLADSFAEHTKVNRRTDIGEQIGHFQTFANISTSLQPAVPNVVDIINALRPHMPAK